jgi:FkbM family methyltransferase
MPSTTNVIRNVVRGIPMSFVGYTRSLALCSRMNYETENLDFIDRIAAGEVMYDLGACEGRFSIYAALKDVRCFSFEPEKRNHQAFSENIAINPIPEGRLQVFKLAIGEKRAQARLRIGQPWAGGHQKVIEQQEVRHDLAFDFVEEEIVDMMGLDEAIAQLGLPRPAYLKVDIDGSEMPFLRGANKTLSDPTLKGLIFELETTDPNFETVIDVLRACGLEEESRYQIPNEPFLYNIIFNRR